jgi:hypothetical protein
MVQDHQPPMVMLETSASVAAEGGTSKSTTGAPVRDTSKSGTGAAKGGTSNAKTSTTGASSPVQKKSNDSSLYDDLPSFHLLNSDGIDDDCSTPPEITCKGAPSSFLFSIFPAISASSPFLQIQQFLCIFIFFLFSFQL